MVDPTFPSFPRLSICTFLTRSRSPVLGGSLHVHCCGVRGMSLYVLWIRGNADVWFVSSSRIRGSMLAKGVSCDGGRLPASVSPASLTGELARGADAE